MKTLWLRPSQVNTLVEMARQAAPLEACGLLVGDPANGQVEQIMPIENVAEDKHHAYWLHPQQQVAAMLQIEQNKQALLALYHTHPNTAPIPSQADIRQATYPQTPYLIISLAKPNPELKAWQIRGVDVTPIDIVVSRTAPQTSKAQLTRPQRATIVISAVFSALILIAYSLYLLPPAPPIPTPGG